MYNLKVTLSLIILVLMAGCAANIKETEKTQFQQLSNIQSQLLFLDVSKSSSLSPSKDLTNSIAELKNLITKNYNGTVADMNRSQNSGIKVNISFENFRYVSGFGRFMAGVMVGDAELKLNVKITDLSSNQIIVESVLDTTSEFSEGIFGATTSRQLDAMSKKIINLVNSSKK